MAGRPRICPICTKIVAVKDSFEYKGKYYHESCFTKFSKQQTKEKTKQSKDKQTIKKIKNDIQKDTHIQIEKDISDEDILAKDKVLNYLKQLLNVSKLNVKIYKLLKDYYSKDKLSYEGMLIALKYFYEIQDNPTVGDCVGIIPYIYNEAQEYEKIKLNIDGQMDGLDMNIIVTQRIVRINKHEEPIKRKEIDISGLR